MENGQLGTPVQQQTRPRLLNFSSTHSPSSFHPPLPPRHCLTSPRASSLASSSQAQRTTPPQQKQQRPRFIAERESAARAQQPTSGAMPLSYIKSRPTSRTLPTGSGSPSSPITSPTRPTPSPTQSANENKSSLSVAPPAGGFITPTHLRSPLRAARTIASSGPLCACLQEALAEAPFPSSGYIPSAIACRPGKGCRSDEPPLPMKDNKPASSSSSLPTPSPTPSPSPSPACSSSTTSTRNLRQQPPKPPLVQVRNSSDSLPATSEPVVALPVTTFDMEVGPSSPRPSSSVASHLLQQQQQQQRQSPTRKKLRRPHSVHGTRPSLRVAVDHSPRKPVALGRSNSSRASNSSASTTRPTLIYNPPTVPLSRAISLPEGSSQRKETSPSTFVARHQEVFAHLHADLTEEQRENFLQQQWEVLEEDALERLATAVLAKDRLRALERQRKEQSAETGLRRLSLSASARPTVSQTSSYSGSPNPESTDDEPPTGLKRLSLASSADGGHRRYRSVVGVPEVAGRIDISGPRSAGHTRRSSAVSAGFSRRISLANSAGADTHRVSMVSSNDDSHRSSMVSSANSDTRRVSMVSSDSDIRRGSMVSSVNSDIGTRRVSMASTSSDVGRRASMVSSVNTDSRRLVSPTSVVTSPVDSTNGGLRRLSLTSSVRSSLVQMSPRASYFPPVMESPENKSHADLPRASCDSDDTIETIATADLDAALDRQLGIPVARDSVVMSPGAFDHSHESIDFSAPRQEASVPTSPASSGGFRAVSISSMTSSYSNASATSSDLCRSKYFDQRFERDETPGADDDKRRSVRHNRVVALASTMRALEGRSTSKIEEDDGWMAKLVKMEAQKQEAIKRAAAAEHGMIVPDPLASEDGDPAVPVRRLRRGTVYAPRKALASLSSTKTADSSLLSHDSSLVAAGQDLMTNKPWLATDPKVTPPTPDPDRTPRSSVQRRSRDDLDIAYVSSSAWHAGATDGVALSGFGPGEAEVLGIGFPSLKRSTSTGLFVRGGGRQLSSRFLLRRCRSFDHCRRFSTKTPSTSCCPTPVSGLARDYSVSSATYSALSRQERQIQIDEMTRRSPGLAHAVAAPSSPIATVEPFPAADIPIYHKCRHIRSSSDGTARWPSLAPTCFAVGFICPPAWAVGGWVAPTTVKNVDEVDDVVEELTDVEAQAVIEAMPPWRRWAHHPNKWVRRCRIATAVAGAVAIPTAIAVGVSVSTSSTPG